MVVERHELWVVCAAQSRTGFRNWVLAEAEEPSSAPAGQGTARVGDASGHSVSSARRFWASSRGGGVLQW